MTTVIIILSTIAILAALLYKPIMIYRERKLRLFCILYSNGKLNGLVEMSKFLQKKDHRKLRQKLAGYACDHGAMTAEAMMLFILKGSLNDSPSESLLQAPETLWEQLTG